MNHVLQHIVFPDDASLLDHQELFYRAPGALQSDTETPNLHLKAGSRIEFNTYLNGLSSLKWKTYTGAEEIALHLCITGNIELKLCGYSLKGEEPVSTVLVTKSFQCDSKMEISIVYPENCYQMLAFEIIADTETILFGGYYSAKLPESSLHGVELAITTTTFRKEEYIKKNVNRIRTGLIERFPEESAHIQMHVVDNGRTLKDEDIPADPHFHLHSNPNAGGSGGFARGMMECMHQTPKATHVLLMDDDVLILPESLYRTYQLLKALKPEFRECFIGGAMLQLEKKNIQHEDIGCITNKNMFKNVKPRWNHYLLKDNLANEKEYLEKNTYQAWWYCCIPMQIIERNGLPLPLFIRGDDAEYSLRAQAKIITMNGICVWHMGFVGKFNPVYDVYFFCRNPLIGQAVTGIASDVDMLVSLKRTFRANLLRHAYVYSEFALRAFEDYMKGPEFFQQQNGEQIISELSALKYTLKPFEELPVPQEIFNDTPGEDLPRTKWNTLLYRLTYNGHLFVPKSLLRKEPVVTSFEDYTPEKTALRKTIVVEDPINQKACCWEIDQKRFRELMTRYSRDLLYYKANKKRIVRQYRMSRYTITSEVFWKNYLELEINK